MPLPIIFIHRGAARHLACAIAQARQSNPGSEIFLLGDCFNRGLIPAKHFWIGDFFGTAGQFYNLYQHRSTNGIEYERFCFQRWFILQEFLEKRGLDACLYLDSDVLLFSNATGEARRFEQYDLTPSHTSPHCMFIHSREKLRKFCSFLMECYSSPELFGRLEKHYLELQARNAPGGVCDMTAFGLYEEMGLGQMADLYPAKDGSAYDHSMSDAGGFEMENGIKKIYWPEKGRPHGRLVANGQMVAFHTLHFQGATKQFMPKHMRLGSLVAALIHCGNRLAYFYGRLFERYKKFRGKYYPRERLHMKYYNFYICHYKKNVERLKYLNSLQMDFQLIADFDREEINMDEMIHPDHGEVLRGQLKQIQYVLKFNEHLAHASKKNQQISAGQIYNSLYRSKEIDSWLNIVSANLSLRSAEVSLFLKHLQALKCFAASSSTNWALIAEDDIVLKDDSLQRLDALVAVIPDPIDYIDVGGGAGLKSEPAFRLLSPEIEGLYLIDPPSSRTTCAYLVSRKFAEKILSTSHQPTMPIDWYLCYLMQLYSAKTCWVEPPIFIHGSEQGYYGSNLR
jgi:GR25 family glycosyltransferase involved in LPS biosynthesis